MKEIVIASSNAHKVEEFQTMLKPLGIKVKSLLDFDEKFDIEENGKTYEENALIKARAISQYLHIPVISDDSGIEIDALDGQPGIYSARFLGYDTSYDIKNQYIIDAANKDGRRGCRYVCAMAYVDEKGMEFTCRGVVEGEVYDRKLGELGFGYDPIFYYPPFQTTLANVSEEQKNEVSHRKNALIKLLAYLQGDQHA